MHMAETTDKVAKMTGRKKRAVKKRMDINVIQVPLKLMTQSCLINIQ